MPKNELTVIVPKGLSNFAVSAIQRLSYLSPNSQFELENESIRITSEQIFQNEEMKRAVLFELYRAKIRDTTQDMQKLLYRAAFSE
jgi:hypothetical protein